MDKVEKLAFSEKLAALAQEIRDNPQARDAVADALVLISAQIGAPCEDCAAKRQALAEQVAVIATPSEQVAVVEPVTDQIAAAEVPDAAALGLPVPDAPDAGADAGQGGTV